MNRRLSSGYLRAAVYCGIFGTASVLWVASAQEQPPPSPTSSNFTGGTVTTLKAEGRLSYYVFAPGARTKWHTHEGGQLLLAEEGRGRTQIRGEVVRDLLPGESTWSPPGATHWHGAAPGQSAKMYQISRGQTTWLEEVTDRDYSATPRR